MLLVIFKVLWLESLSLVKVPIVSHHKARDKLIGRKFMKIEEKKKLKSSRKALEITRGLTRDDCMHVCTIIFWVLRTMSVLAVAKRAANAVVQKCRVLSHPSKCILICRCRCKGKGHHIMYRVWTCPVLCRVR